MVSQNPENVINVKNFRQAKRLRGWSGVILAALALNIMSGVAVAGIDAGKVFNTWPLMNGAWIPGGYWKSDLGWRNAFENMGCVQFNHRQFAYATYGLATWVFWTFRGLVLPGATLRVLV